MKKNILIMTFVFILVCVIIQVNIPVKACASELKDCRVVNPYEPITHEKMKDYIKKLETEFPELLETEVIGKSVDGRDIILVKMGKGDHLFNIIGSMHARERITTNIILQNIEDYGNAFRKNKKIDGYDVRKLLDQVTIYFVPNANPDGVDYTILGEKAILTDEAREAYQEVKTNPHSKWWDPDLRWKANIRGVDLNYNWDFGWDKEDSFFDIGKPADAFFKGHYPHSEPEVKAIKRLTVNHPFLMYFSYHTQGRLIFWYKYQTGEDLEDAIEVTKKIEKYTGFVPVPAANNIPENHSSYRGYADWTVAEFNKIGMTIEFAQGAYCEKDFDEIYKPGKALPLLLAAEVLRLESKYDHYVYIEDQLVQRFKNLDESREFINKNIKGDVKDSVKVEVIRDDELLIQGESLLPLRAVLEECGMEIHWYGSLGLKKIFAKPGIIFNWS